MRVLDTFRGRLFLVLAILLIATLGVQYYLNVTAERENTEMREAQEQAIVQAIALGVYAFQLPDLRLQDLLDMPNQNFLDEEARQRIKDIIIVDDKWQVTDSLNTDYLPIYRDDDDDDNDVTFKKLADLKGLPPLQDQKRLGADVEHFPNRKTDANKNDPDEAHAVPIQTSKGKWYIIVLLRKDPSTARWRAARPLVYTLSIFLVSSFITLFLVWRFTKPIANLSIAARSVASGDLSVRVPDTDRRDEIGRLASRFNEMTAELEKKRELEAQLQQAEKSAVVGRLGSAIAHEIRNPLNYINLTLDHLRIKFAPADPVQKGAFDKLTLQLKSEVARINQQISDFLNYSRPARAELRPLVARDVVEESLRIIEPQAEELGVKISVVEHENVPRIAGDPEFLRSVFNNLFINAIQAMERAGGRLTVKISAEAEDDLVTFEISDTGSGISNANLETIFEPYFSTKETGTGLGLAIVQKIVDIHGGTIEVVSREGSGTTFTVKLPVAK